MNELQRELFQNERIAENNSLYNNPIYPSKKTMFGNNKKTIRKRHHMNIEGILNTTSVGTNISMRNTIRAFS